MHDLWAFGRVVEALRPWLDHLVVVGGWAHRLYQFSDLAETLPYHPLTTNDADIAFAREAPLRGDMGEALRAAGFTEEFSGEQSPPVSAYRLGAEEQGFYAEFLTPLSGSRSKRNGSEDATLAKAGVTAQKLRYLETLMVAPWPMSLDGEEFRLNSTATVQVANPVAFIAHKLLIHSSRRPDKRAQDVLYIHDTLQLFSGELDSLRRMWLNDVMPEINKHSEIERLAQEQYGNVTDFHRDAAMIPHDRSLTAENLRAACIYGLETVFFRAGPG